MWTILRCICCFLNQYLIASLMLMDFLFMRILSDHIINRHLEPSTNSSIKSNERHKYYINTLDISERNMYPSCNSIKYVVQFVMTRLFLSPPNVSLVHIFPVPYIELLSQRLVLCNLLIYICCNCIWCFTLVWIHLSTVFYLFQLFK